MGTMAKVVSKPESFVNLDKFINNPDNRRQVHDDLPKSELNNIGFVAGGVFGPGGSLWDHWKNDWVGEFGKFGGSYWPYLWDIDIALILREGFRESTEIAFTKEKIHNTLWICAGRPPEAWLSVDPMAYQQKAKIVAPMGHAEQQSWFECIIQESDHVVNLLICTPMSIAEALAKQTNTPIVADDPESIRSLPEPV